MTPITPRSIHEVLARQPLFRGLNNDELALLLPGVQEFKVAAREVLFHKGDLLEGLYMVVSGQVKLLLPTPQGSEKVITLINPGSTFAEAVIFLDGKAPVTAQTTQDSAVLLVQKNVLLAVLDHNPVFARKMLAGLSARLHELVNDMETCTLMSSVQRVVCYLSHQAPQEDMQDFEIQLDTSKQTLASRLNLAPETFSRALHHLTSTGLIEVQGKRIRVRSLDRLKNFVG